MSDDIHAAITSSIAEIDGAGDNGDVTADPAPAASTSDPTPAAPAASATAPAAPPADPTKPIIPETIAEGEPKRPGRIPTDRHEKIVAGMRTEHEQALTKVRAEAEAQLGEARQQLQLLQIADTDPARFLDALVRADPRYAQLIAQRGGNGNGHAPQPSPTAAPVAAEMPQPNARLADGSVGYDLDGLKALMDWNAAQVEQRVLKQFAPVLEDHQAREATSAAIGRVTAQVEQAQQWDGFNENQKEIAAALRADRSLSLEGAYRRVVMSKLKASRDTMRAELLAEINGKPKTVTTTNPSGTPPPTATSDDLQSIIRASISNLRGQA